MQTDLNQAQSPIGKFLDFLWRALVIIPVLDWQEWRCSRAKKYLLKHDSSYRMSHIGMEIVKRRNTLYSEGVDPMDPSIPDHMSVEKELPRMSWPRKEHSF